ncbi:hypothetical protein [Microbaculum marinum]|uniref:AdoMet activation domain-containing protein n=1 Tax=Microbaculum marinum TaxID=1764581 RepID=A0AAW9RTX9_9HYPH
MDGFAVDAERILRVQGYRDPARIRPRIRKIAERAAADIADIARPEARYLRRAIRSVSGGTLEIEGGHRFSCVAFERLLGNATEVVVFVLTLGPGLETAVAERFTASEPVDALFLECAGWLCVEKATRHLAAHLGEEAKPDGLSVTYRLGPGYDYKAGEERAVWGLEEQPALFAVFGDAPLPVELLESCAMSPKLSRSGLFGLAPRA